MTSVRYDQRGHIDSQAGQISGSAHDYQPGFA
jgi:hypothetical protein